MDLQEEIAELMGRKDAIEKEISDNLNILQSQKGVGMDGPLLDNEQFPRNDIDLPLVRSCRHTVICRQNDYKAIMQQIEKKLHELHAKVGPSGVKSAMEVDDDSVAHASASSQTVFAMIDQVDSNSPASSAGFQIGDEIIQFGTVTTTNFANLQSIAAVVQHSQGRPLPVIVLRNGQQVRLVVTPNVWSGRGLLGCHIVPTQK